MERKIPDLDRSDDLQRASALRHVLVGNLWHRIDDFQHPFPRCHPALKDVRDPAERNHRPAEHREIRIEGEELAQADPAANDGLATEPQHQQRAQSKKERHARIEQPLQPYEQPIAPDVFFVGASEPLHLSGFLAIGSHHANAGEILLDYGAQLRQLRLDRLEALVDGSPEVVDAQRHERQGHNATSVNQGSIDSITAIATMNTRMVLAVYITAGPIIMRTAFRSLVARDIRSPVRRAW